MSDWTHGYVADVTYTPGFYRESMPTWLSFASTLLAQRPPDLSRPFRYADFGCGQGMSLLVAAATAPLATYLKRVASASGTEPVKVSSVMKPSAPLTAAPALTLIWPVAE